MFDEKSKQALRYYVYMLLDPVDNTPFYIGKGVGNRLFQHISFALSEIESYTAKYGKIREIIQKGGSVKHVVIRHGLSENEAYQVEAALIDTLSFCGIDLANLVKGHHSIEKGIMTAEEITRLYNAQPLYEIQKDCVLININRSYERGAGSNSIYLATKETWLIAKTKLPSIKYVLSEYRGLIVEVFEVEHWYSKSRTKNKTINAVKVPVEVTGYGFEGKIAPAEIRNLYINKSVAHLKRKGAAQVIRFNI
jgi:hypothetical protein